MSAQADVGYHARQQARWHWGEAAFWIAALACAFIFPSRYLIMTDIVRLALFALSLDLILGYAGIVSLGHAAFFGVGAYSAGLLALNGVITEPVVALDDTQLASVLPQIDEATKGLPFTKEPADKKPVAASAYSSRADEMALEFALLAARDVDEAPSFTNRRAVASARPLPPPVITATLPCNLDILHFLHDSGIGES